MDDLIHLLRVTAATEVTKRWNVTDDRLNEIVSRYKLPLYSICEERIRPDDGKTIYFCQGPFFRFYYEGPFGEGHYELEGIYFNTETVELFENEHPEILWIPANNDHLEKEYGEYIPAEAIRKQLNMSPIQFIDFMNSGQGPVCSWEEGFRKHQQNLYPTDDFFSTDALKDAGFTFHVIDWLSWQKKRGGEGEAVNAAPQSAGLESENKQLRGKQAELEQELAACREQLEKARIEKPAPNARTSAATQARQEKKLTEWRGAFKVMLKVVLQCQAEGPRSRTTPELENMCARHDYKPTGEQIKFLRKCLLETLGSDYVNTTGGPTIQG